MIDLIAHPAGTDAARTLSAEVARQGNELHVRFVVHCVADMFVPPPAMPVRTDGLWRTSCFELFVRGDSDAYAEYNLSPSGAWAAYAFSGRRTSMRAMPCSAPVIEWTVGQQSGALLAIIAADRLSDLLGHRPWSVNLAAVCENHNGRLDYHALAHPDGPPDFHDPACFVLSLA